MTHDEINKKLIYQSVKDGSQIIPTPEDLKKKYGQGLPAYAGWSWQEYQKAVVGKKVKIGIDWAKPTVEKFEEENLLNQLFEIMKGKLQSIQ